MIIIVAHVESECVKGSVLFFMDAVLQPRLMVEVLCQIDQPRLPVNDLYPCRLVFPFVTNRIHLTVHEENPAALIRSIVLL